MMCVVDIFILFVFMFFSFPEIDFFKDDDIRNVMTNVLFCYARANSRVVYKQVDFVSF